MVEELDDAANKRAGKKAPRQFDFSKYKKQKISLMYVRILNGVLPSKIRALSWAHVADEFDARHSCTSRVYKYYFPKATLDVDAMRTAGQQLVGTHDFRNFCKLALNPEKTDVKDTVRTIHSLQINQIGSEPASSGYCMYELQVTGSGFLHHQIRYIVAVLLEVGNKLEPPDTIRDLLDIDKYPSKPQYALASELPLILFDTAFESTDITWKTDEDSKRHTISHMQKLWAEHQIKATMIRDIIGSLEKACDKNVDEQANILYPGPRPKSYMPICQRQTGDGPAEKKRKLDEKQSKFNTKLEDKILN